MKGDTFPFSPQKVDQGGQSPCVTRLTPDGEVCNHLYFTNRSYTSDDRKIIYQSERDGGNALFCIDLDKNTVTQLTEGKNLDYFPHPSRDNKLVFYGDGACIRAVNIETLEETTLLDAGELTGLPVKKCSGTFPSWDGKKLVCFYEAPDVPEYGLIVINLEDGSAKVILRGTQHVRHCQFCPQDYDLIVYAHEGNWATIDARMWLIRADGSENRRVRDHDDGEEQVGHEFWANTKRIIYFTVRREGKVYFSQYDVDAGRESTLFELDNEHCSISPADDVVIADNKYGDCAMLLATLDGKTVPLCYPEMSWKREMSRFHPHPTFNYAGDKVIYTTDAFGTPGVFTAEIPKKF